MANMAHCRFQNTLAALRDCEEHLDDPEEDEAADREGLSESEADARRSLIALCQRIAKNHEEDF